LQINFATAIVFSQPSSVVIFAFYFLMKGVTNPTDVPISKIFVVENNEQFYNNSARLQLIPAVLAILKVID
jgi:hypothetical protein